MTGINSLSMKTGIISFGLEADFESSSGTAYKWELVLYREDDTSSPVYSIGFSGTDGKAVSKEFRTSKGTYYAKLVLPYEYKGKDYKFSVNFKKDSNYETEPNGSAETANGIKLNSYMSGNSSAGYDNDFYKFTVDKRGIINFSLS